MTDGDPLAPLLARFRRGRGEAEFRALYRAATPRLWRFALRRAQGDAATAEELVQETWVRFVGELERFRGASTLATWLAGILLHCDHERSRSEARRGEGLDDLDELAVEGGLSPEASLALARALDDLPRGRRAVLELHDVGGLTHDEIAHRLGIAPGTSKSQLHRARARLRALLSGKERP
ncbi:MAG: RNA polymerase sigma factor [Thermoanaerobaculia bacterium]